MRTFKAAKASVTESWELMLPEGHGVSIEQEVALLDAYEAAVAQEGWRARVLADAGEAGIGDVIAVGITSMAFVGFMAWFSSYITAAVS